MAELLQIASWTTWCTIACAAASTLAGILLLAHARLLARVGGRMPHGAYDAGALATSIRWGIGLLGFGILLWGLEMRWSAVTVGVVAGGVTLFAGLEAVARWEASTALQRKVENR